MRNQPTAAAPKGTSGHHLLDGLPILMYHSISPEAAPKFARFAMHPGDFAAQMAYLADAGYQSMTVTDAMAVLDRRQPLPERAVVLTFDDGFADFHTMALPILQENRLRATLYVVTSYIGRTGLWNADCGEQDRPMIGWPQLREAAEQGVEIGAHSHTHPQLDRLDATRCTSEIRRSKAVLEDRLGIAVNSFAYPFGYRVGATERAVAAAGFDSAVGVDDLRALRGENRFALPRLTVNAGTSTEEFRQLLLIRPSRRTLAAVPIKRALWRAARRCTHLQPQWRDPTA
jgi:peptidoglycan/xylan/chitin deacetylase (PgdA/CDA1 family)